MKERSHEYWHAVVTIQSEHQIRVDPADPDQYDDIIKNGTIMPSFADENKRIDVTYDQRTLLSDMPLALFYD
jgi:hypothetical protein